MVFDIPIVYLIYDITITILNIHDVTSNSLHTLKMTSILFTLICFTLHSFGAKFEHWIDQKKLLLIRKRIWKKTEEYKYGAQLVLSKFMWFLELLLLKCIVRGDEGMLIVQRIKTSVVFLIELNFWNKLFVTYSVTIL